MNRKFRTWDKAVEERLAEDPEDARIYLLEAFKELQDDKDLPAFLVALRHVVNAQGGIGRLAARTGLNRRHLYRMLSHDGNPHLVTIMTIMKALNIQIEKLGEYHPA